MRSLIHRNESALRYRFEGKKIKAKVKLISSDRKIVEGNILPSPKLSLRSVCYPILQYVGMAQH